MDRPTLKQLIFDWKIPDNYHKLCNFEKEIKNIFMTKNYNIQESEKVKCLGCEGLRFVQTLKNEEHEKCTSSGLYVVLSDNMYPQDNEAKLVL